jgi:hypothetical protein
MGDTTMNTATRTIRITVIAAAVLAGVMIGIAISGTAASAQPAAVSCSVAGHDDGTATITCPDGTTATLNPPPGPQGPAGADGPQGPHGHNGANGTNGTDGASCAVSDNGNRSHTLTCGATQAIIPTDGPANLAGAFLNPANSTPGPWLTNADLSGANLTNASLEGADLEGADLTGADLTNAFLGSVTWSNTTCPDGTNTDTNGDGNCDNRRTP